MNIYEQPAALKEYICPYSNNGKCSACNILKIACDGDRFINCEQYLIVSMKEAERRDKDG